MYLKCSVSLYLILSMWKSEDTTQNVRCLLWWFLRSTMCGAQLLHTPFSWELRRCLIAPGTELVTASSRRITSNVCAWFPYWNPVEFVLMKSTFWNKYDWCHLNFSSPSWLVFLFSDFSLFVKFNWWLLHLFLKNIALIKKKKKSQVCGNYYSPSI